MPKIFYTERDIEDLAKQGVKSIEVNDDVVVTDAAREKARRVGVDLVQQREPQPAAAVPPPSTVPKPAAPPAHVPVPSAAPARAAESDGDLEARVYNSVKARLNGQVDDALLRTIVKRVLMSLGRH